MPGGPIIRVVSARLQRKRTVVPVPFPGSEQLRAGSRQGSPFEWARRERGRASGRVEWARHERGREVAESNGGRGWNRTTDPSRVKRMLYR